MKKIFKSYVIAWAVMFALFQIICFATPATVSGVEALEGMNKYGGAFWAGYAGITAAFIGQLLCAKKAFSAENSEKLFLDLPLIRISYIGTVVMLVVGAAAMLIPDLPNWLGAIVCLAVLAFTAVAVTKAAAAAEIIAAKDEEIKVRTSFVRSLTSEAQGLTGLAKSEEAKAACKKVYEALRYSDPMSSADLENAENRIMMKFGEFSAAVKNASDNTEGVAEELVQLIADRNRQCKALK